MKEETALTWLIKRVNQDCTNSVFIRPELIEKAIQLEKHEIMKAFYNGSLCDEGWGADYAEAYYDETYQIEQAENE
jgi:hypothetical protein